VIISPNKEILPAGFIYHAGRFFYYTVFFPENQGSNATISLKFSTLFIEKQKFPSANN
jgi:hypothetical protein